MSGSGGGETAAAANSEGCAEANSGILRASRINDEPFRLSRKTLMRLAQSFMLRRWLVVDELVAAGGSAVKSLWRLLGPDVGTACLRLSACRPAAADVDLFASPSVWPPPRALFCSSPSSCAVQTAIHASFRRVGDSCLLDSVVIGTTTAAGYSAKLAACHRRSRSASRREFQGASAYSMPAFERSRTVNC